LAGIVPKQSIYCGWGGWQMRQPTAQKGSFSPKVTQIRDKLPPERLFLPETDPNPGQIPPRNTFSPQK